MTDEKLISETFKTRVFEEAEKYAKINLPAPGDKAEQLRFQIGGLVHAEIERIAPKLREAANEIASGPMKEAGVSWR